MNSARLLAPLAGAAMLLAACGDEGPDDVTGDENGAAEPAADAGGAEGDIGDSEDAEVATEADGLCELLDPEGLQEYHDFLEYRVVGATESDEGYEACQWEADGEEMTGWTYTITLLDWGDDRFEGQTGQEGFDTFMQNRLEEDGRATYLERYDGDIDRDALEWVDDAAYTRELYILSGDHVLRLDGNPFGSSQSGRMVDAGHFPTMDPDEVL
jgi:hypothetical protein